MRSNAVTVDYINGLIKDNPNVDANQISDGYHTFGELYDHRCTLFVVLAQRLKTEGKYVWRSQVNSDGSKWDGWFLLGVGLEEGHQISYHLPIEKYWELTDFAVTLENAPKFDGHTPDDVLNRLLSYEYVRR